jgi:predicted  nucleic acid-binding Zn-ribbon protein
MPHSCAVCGAVYASLVELEQGACPVCHACKFIYESSHNSTQYTKKSLFEEEHKTEEINKPDPSDERTVSVRVRRPGTYEINLRQMVESSDRVICFEKKGTYHLDLHSMVGKRKS